MKELKHRSKQVATNPEELMRFNGDLIFFKVLTLVFSFVLLIGFGVFWFWFI